MIWQNSIYQPVGCFILLWKNNLYVVYAVPFKSKSKYTNFLSKSKKYTEHDIHICLQECKLWSILIYVHKYGE